jgi:hypothetical protein
MSIMADRRVLRVSHSLASKISLICVANPQINLRKTIGSAAAGAGRSAG